MRSEFEWKSLGDIAAITKLAGFEFTKYIEYKDTGDVIALRALNIRDGILDLNEIKRIDKSVSDGLPRSKLYKNDIIFTYTGNGYGDAAIIDANDRYHLAPNIAKISPLEIEPYFLFRFIKSDLFYQQVKNHIVGSSQPTIPMKTIRQLRVPYPSRSVQCAIAATFSCLDDKIALNNRINANLEAQAQAIFKSWFVDYEPFQDGEFIDSELGMIPKGWRVGVLSDISYIVGGATPSKEKEEYFTESGTGIAWITPKDLSINKNKFIAHGEIDITELGYKSASTKLMPDGSVLFSSRAPIGYMAISSGEVCTNQGFKSVVPKDGIGNGYIYYMLKSRLDEIQNLGSGSTFKEVSGSVMKSIKVIIPDMMNLKAFQKHCGAVLAQQKLLEEQSSILAATRDTLLPKLMNGEIEVPVAESIMQERGL